jgi:hypothetical protein
MSPVCDLGELSVPARLRTAVPDPAAYFCATAAPGGSGSGTRLRIAGIDCR